METEVEFQSEEREIMVANNEDNQGAGGA